MIYKCKDCHPFLRFQLHSIATNTDLGIETNVALYMRQPQSSNDICSDYKRDCVVLCVCIYTSL